MIPVPPLGELEWNDLAFMMRCEGADRREEGKCWRWN